MTARFSITSLLALAHQEHRGDDERQRHRISGRGRERERQRERELGHLINFRIKDEVLINDGFCVQASEDTVLNVLFCICVDAESMRPLTVSRCVQKCSKIAAKVILTAEYTR